MQIFFRALLAIYLAHLLTDFVFQTHRLVEQKRRGRPLAYFIHGLTHYLSAVILVGFFIAGSGLLLWTHLVLLALTLVHLFIDFAKIRLTQKALVNDGPVAYISDQLLHFLSVALAALFFTPGMPFAELAAWVGRSRAIPSRFLLVPAIYIGVIFGGGYLIRALTRPLSASLGFYQPEKSGGAMQNAGLYIGWLERFLLLTALLMQSPGTAGLILAAKAIARYPEFKSERFAEYFLIGTLLSFSLAVLGGAVLVRVLLGQFRVGG